VDALLIGVIVIGLLHGLEPGHGWPIAMLRSIREEHPYVKAVEASLVLAACHFISSISAALIYVIAAQFVAISTYWLQIVAIVMLVILAIRFWREKADTSLQSEDQHDHLHGNTEAIVHAHEHAHLNGDGHVHEHAHLKGFPMTMVGLAGYGFVLGFAHEEEFALLALAVAGVDPWLLMVLYGACVTASLVAITLVSVKIYKVIAPWIKQRVKYIPKISAITLIVLAAFIAIELFL
jgi:nickel/cobalt exporter